MFPVLLWCAYESLWHTVITFCSWLSLHFFSSKLAAFQSMSRIRLILRSVSHPCDFWFQFRDVYSNHSDEQWLSFSWLCGNSVSIVFQVRDSLCLHQIDFLWLVSLVIFVSSFVVSVGICLTNNDDFSHLIVHFLPVQFVALQSMSLGQIDFLWIVSVW